MPIPESLQVSADSEGKGRRIEDEAGQNYKANKIKHFPSYALSLLPHSSKSCLGLWAAKKGYEPCKEDLRAHTLCAPLDDTRNLSSLNQFIFPVDIYDCLKGL